MTDEPEPDFVKDPLIELLAIKLHEHDTFSKRYPPDPKESKESWMALCSEDRDAYRELARGKGPLP